MRFTSTFDRLPDQVFLLLDRLPGHSASHCSRGQVNHDWDAGGDWESYGDYYDDDAVYESSERRRAAALTKEAAASSR